MKISTGYENRKPEIAIVPLLDVVFLLLVVFIYAMLSMTVFKGLKIDLPRASGMAETKEAVVITITSDNMFYIGDWAMEIDEAVKEAVKRSAVGNKSVLISGDRGADLGVAVELLAKLRKRNITSVSFQVKEAE
jgi:biopolymer transport protein ExbD